MIVEQSSWIHNLCIALRSVSRYPKLTKHFVLFCCMAVEMDKWVRFSSEYILMVFNLIDGHTPFVVYKDQRSDTPIVQKHLETLLDRSNLAVAFFASILAKQVHLSRSSDGVGTVE